MIKARANKGKSVVKAVGTVEDIVCELGAIINHVYKMIAKKYPRAAEVFRLAMQDFVSDGSPVWRIDSLPDFVAEMEAPVKSEE